jgi:RNA recognition motif-containing protein
VHSLHPFNGLLFVPEKIRIHFSFVRSSDMNIYVGNLSFEATESDVESAFSQYGEVKSVSIVKDRETGRSRGFGFVEMRDSNDGKDAIEGVNLKEIAGRAVTVNEARPREERSSGGGRRW